MGTNLLREERLQWILVEAGSESGRVLVVQREAVHLQRLRHQCLTLPGPHVVFKRRS